MSWLRWLNGCPSDSTSSEHGRLESREPSRDPAPSSLILPLLRAVMGRLSHSVTLSSLLFRPSLPSSASYLGPSFRLLPKLLRDSRGTDAGASRQATCRDGLSEKSISSMPSASPLRPRTERGDSTSSTPWPCSASGSKWLRASPGNQDSASSMDRSNDSSRTHPRSHCST